MNLHSKESTSRYAKRPSKPKVKSYKDYLKEDQEKGNPAAIEAKIPNKYYKNNVSKYDL
jgi:hypothetical protein